MQTAGNFSINSVEDQMQRELELEQEAQEAKNETPEEELAYLESKEEVDKANSNGGSVIDTPQKQESLKLKDEKAENLSEAKLSNKGKNALQNSNDSLGMIEKPSNSPDTSLTLDDYYQGMEELVDAALATITSKIAEKRNLELENSSIKVMLAKVKEDIKREQQTQRALKKSIEQEKDLRKKHERENEEHIQAMELMNSKAESRREEIARQLVDTEAYYNELKESIAAEKAKIESIKEQLKNMSVEVRNEIRSLEIANAEAIGFLDELKKKTDYDRLVKNERMKTIKQKTKALAALLAQDNPIPKTTTRKNTSSSRILKPH